MNKQESKYFYTASLFDEALIELLQDKDIEYITVKELCNKAGVNRSTFYLHYETINDLLDETNEYILNKFLAKFNADPSNFISNLDSYTLDDLNFINDRYLVPYLEFIKENKKVFLTVIKNSKTMKTQDALRDLSKYILAPIMSKYGVPEEDIQYCLAFYIQGISAVIKIWIINDCEDDIQYIIKIIYDCVRPYQSNF